MGILMYVAGNCETPPIGAHSVLHVIQQINWSYQRDAAPFLRGWNPIRHPTKQSLQRFDLRRKTGNSRTGIAASAREFLLFYTQQNAEINMWQEARSLRRLLCVESYTLKLQLSWKNTKEYFFTEILEAKQPRPSGANVHARVHSISLNAKQFAMFFCCFFKYDSRLNQS